MSGFFRCVLCVLLAAALTGCGGEPKRDLPKGTVKGTVTFKGQPLPAGTVAFQHASGEMSSASIDASGQYQLDAAVGSNKVMVQSMEEQKPNPDPNGMPRMLPGASRIPEKYSNFSTSGLSHDVKAGEQTIDLKLEE
jgi:hypothetical protein